MTSIVVTRGTYASKEVVNQAFTMVHAPRTGVKGLYVTVDGAPLGFPNRNIRVQLDAETDVVYGDAAAEAAAPAAPKETDEEIMQRMRKKFEVLDNMTLAATEGHVRSLIVTGPPGVGKSFGVEKVIDQMEVMSKMADLQDRDGVTIPKHGVEKVASASALGLYQLLWEYRGTGSLLVLDDSDSVLYDEAGINMLKAATDSGEKRKLTWRTESKVLDERGIPSEFNFKGSIIFITNLDFENARGKIGDHLKAIVSRSHYLDMGIHDAHEKFLRCKQIVRDGMLDAYHFQPEQRQEILDYIETHSGQLRELSLRMVKKIADLVKMDPRNWRDYADQTCLRGR